VKSASIRTAPAPPPSPCPTTANLDFDALYDEHFAFAWRTARRMGIPESAADDVVQNAFLVIHRRLADYDGHTPVRRWLLGILSRVVADHRRTYWRKDARCVSHDAVSEGVGGLPSSWSTPLEHAEQSDALRLVVALLSELDEDKREVFVLAQLEEMSAPEIAECLGLNLNTVYARLRAARQAFDAAYARHSARQARRTP
jgi:RNA polymerase sigma-70 factor (ECF subfamily)